MTNINATLAMALAFAVSWNAPKAQNTNRCGDLVRDLFICQFLCRTEETIARVVDHHVDLAEIGEGPVHDPIRLPILAKHI